MDPCDYSRSVLYAFPAKNGMERTGYSATAKGTFTLSDMSHDLIFGADYQKGHSWTEQRTTDLNASAIEVCNPIDPHELASYPTKDDDHITAHKVAFAMTRLSLSDALKLSIDGRAADDSYENNSPTTQRRAAKWRARLAYIGKKACSHPIPDFPTI